ncbi:MAG: S41 family peptidase [Syntrophobacterales bacterium]|nr:MAG: S41 family peptidase [Syntrophobacterales bacterium]
MHITFAKRVILYIFFISILILLAVPGFYREETAFSADKDTYRSLRLFNEILDMIEKNYVDEVDTKEMIDGAIKGMVKSLDPHSEYMSKQTYEDMQIGTKGEFGGLGIEITMRDDIITVVSPIEDTPAFIAGIKAGDQIIGIDGKSTKGLSIMDAVHKLRGKKGTKVTVTIQREGFEKPRDFEIIRDIIKIESVKYKIYPDKIGYIKLSNFQETTLDELKKALGEMAEEEPSLTGLVLDLRNNPGGLLDQSVSVSDIFLKSGIIVSSKGRTKSTEKIYRAKDDGNEPEYPIVILINGGTASASEIVSGALHDNKRAALLGTQTFGKGSVQVLRPLKDGSALKLTIARYYTPEGKSIQATGITPDIPVEYIKQNNNNTVKRIREKDLEGHIEGKVETPEESEEIPAESEEEEEDEVLDDVQKDNQLKSAIDILKSWEIFKKM